jgi:hypothetical protein
MSVRLDHAPIAKAGSPTDRGYGAFFRAEPTPPLQPIANAVAAKRLKQADRQPPATHSTVSGRVEHVAADIASRAAGRAQRSHALG